MGSRVVEIADVEIAILKQKMVQSFAINNTCPHKKEINEGLVHESVVTCPFTQLECGFKKW